MITTNISSSHLSSNNNQSNNSIPLQFYHQASSYTTVSSLSSTCTLAQLCSQWAESLRYQIKPSSYALYLTMIEKHILPELGNYPVAEINNQVMEQFMRKIQYQGLAWNTQRLIVFLIKSVLQTGEESGIYTAERLHYSIPKSKKTGMRVFNHESAEKLMNYLENSEEVFETGLLISFCTGIRVGELCGLQWQDVDWKGGTLRINRTVSRIRNLTNSLSKTMIYIGSPKTGTSIREIPLPDFLILKMLKNKREGSCYILTGTTKCMEPRSVQRKFKTVLKKCSIPDINIHSLRHMFASKWIENGFDYKALSEILGHSSIKITMDIYVHSNMEQKKAYMNCMR